MPKFGISPIQILFILSLIAVALISLHMLALPNSGSQNSVDEIVSKLYGGDLGAARNLVKNLGDIDSKASNGSPLVVAMAQVPGINDGAFYDQVFEKRPNCNAKDTRGMTALYSAASLGNLDLINRLLKGGADPNLDSDYGSALVGASWNNRDAAAHRLLLIPGVNVDSADRQGRTALVSRDE
jgi:ankyrin repeat protein